MSLGDLRNVAKARARLRAAEADLTAAIMRAREAGETFRDIAEYAELSHQRVHEIVRQEERRRAE